MVIFTSSLTYSFKYSWFYRSYTKLPGTFHFLTEPGLFCCALLQDAEERYGNVVLLQLSIDSTIRRKTERVGVGVLVGVLQREDPVRNFNKRNGKIGTQRTRSKRHVKRDKKICNDTMQRGIDTYG